MQHPTTLLAATTQARAATLNNHMAHTFTPDEASRGGTRTVQRLHKARLETYQRGQLLDRVTEAIEEGDIGTAAYQTAMNVIARIDSVVDTMPMGESIDIYRAGQVAETVYKIHRLATGQSTSNAAHATVDATELADRKAVLLARLSGTDTPP